MVKWAFISDFDGTISKKEFYWILIDTYFPEGKQLYHRWKNGELTDIEFIKKVFGSINQSEDIIKKQIQEMPLDEHAIPFIHKVLENDGDFYILSPGTDYYIQQILAKNNLSNIDVFSNKGFFKDKNIHLEIDRNAWNYSEHCGVDMEVTFKKLKEPYDYVFYYGDSELDALPAKYADQTFAKNLLINALIDNKQPFIPVRDFKDVQTFLTEEGWIMKG
ncbi:2,3-diketo-5-methylthio-1-phosphopentane phosphatase [Salipaludibacillus neizhouensis]|uniref:2,3-diketo-5-methylthio-1-phosphopentane phosphatase n=1 Tax=Salipaludibacillus neizhouensis TaxID=885475 RepID=A0A3A9KFE3_9BACI|nr:MtnX-like HAD-IB family phosphatase [Salipaludibacillus neizhouensis]RKL69301.1 2,3-diketo-5-methylthio-1-phosphopentane phosphatase [Salipaludibacillus neizhouensis]